MSSRTLETNTKTQSQAAANYMVIFAKLEFGSGDVLIHSDLGDITWGGDTYLGVGTLGSITPVEEQAELGRSVIKMSLSGVSASLISTALGEDYQGKDATIYVGYKDLSTNALVADPSVHFKGRMDVMEVVSGETAEITLTVESKMAAWDKPNVRRYNHQDQISRYPNDKFFEFIEQTAQKPIVWGRKG